MKTFTTYAEKKAKQFFNLLQGYTKGIRITAILILLLMGVSNAWAVNHTGGYVYFLKPSTWTESTVMMFIGKDEYDNDYTTVYTMTKIANTDNLYRYTMPEYDNANYVTFANASSAWGSGNWYSGNRTNAPHYTNVYNDYGFNSGSYYVVVPASTSNNAGITINYKSGASDLNLTTQANVYGSTDGGSTYSSMATAGTVSISGYYMSSYNTASTRSAVSSTASQAYASTTLAPGSTATFKATANTGYEFVGWFTEASGGTAVSTDATYTFKYDISYTGKTLYARFKEVSYYIKHPFDGSEWTWEEMTKQDDGTFTLDAKWYGGGVNINTTANDQGSTWIEANKIPGAPNNQTGITVTYIYNPTDKSLKIEAKNIYLVGEFNDWNTSDDWELKEDPANPGIYTLTKRFEARDRHQTTTQGQPEYEFKLNIKGTNYTVEGNGSNKHLQYTRQSTSKVINDGTAYSGPYYNLLLQADITGDYVFTYDAATQTLTVQHPEYQPEASYLVGDFSDGVAGTDKLPKDGGDGKDWTEAYGIPITVNGNTGTVEICDWPAGTWEFKVKINGIWYGLKDLNITKSGTYELTDDYAEMGDRNISITTYNDECYSFMYTQNNDGTLDLLVIYGNETHKVTFHQNGHGTAPAQQTILYGKTATKPIMDDADGYMFAGWYTNAACTAGKEYDFDTPVESDITLYAKWIPYTQCIFFKNTLGWKDVFVYTFSDNVWYDNEDGETKYGPGVCTKTQNNLHYGEMTQIGESDIFYFILPNTTGFNHIAFSDFPMNDWNEFYGHNAIYRSDRSDQMQLFIPQKEQSPSTTNSTKYYSSGLWMKYNSTVSGYDWSSNVNDWNTTTNTFTAEKAGGYSFTTEVKLTAGTTYEFKIHNLNGTWFGNGGTMTQNRCTNWHFWENNDSNNAKITPTITGNYVFTIYLGDGEVRVSLDYPLSVGDYRLVYKDNTHGAHDGHYIKKRTDIAEQRDTVSFFIHKDKSPQILLQYCSAISNDGKPTWTTSNTYNSLGDAVTTTAVYNFILKQTNSGNSHTCSIVTEETHKYTGNFYIRTDAAAGGWKTFRQEGNRMTYSSFAESNTNPKFNHYFCEWITANRNVKFTIANDYSYCISDTLDGDNIINKNGVSPGCLPADANVRFGWDSRDNSISRAYIAGSGHKKDRFLVIEGNAYLKDIDGNAYTGNTGEGQERYNLKDHEVVLKDMGNWIYQMDVTANSKTEYKLTALYNGIVQYFKGTSTTTERMLATDNQNQDTSFKIRLIYDFKTNHIVAAWLADDTPGELGADMMVIRENQGDATQIAFNGDKLTNVQKAYAVMTFTKDFVNGSEPIHARKHYWISFPFDVKISEVFGFSEYMDHWILQLYDGQKRADEGWWYESGTFWKYITNKNYTLKKGVGYVLTLDLSKMGANSSVFKNTDEVSLYFPSTGLINTISGEETTNTTVDPHECTIERENRKIYDSHWNIIGVPGFANISGYSTEEPIINSDTEHGGGPSFYYKYLPASNSYQATTTENTFKTMYGYMVQYTGNLSWTTTIAVPNNIAARRNSESDEPEKISFRLEIAQDDVMADQTFVQMQQEGATAEFDMNLDLTKIINSGANIYTLAGEQRIQSAGNALPMGEAVVPVGVKIATEGEYTFRMPDGTEGMVVELIDYETNTRTNLLLSDYTITLSAGSYENRFALDLQPQKDVTTGVGNVGDETKGIEKYLIDGKLIIRTAEGAVYDAQGHRL